MQDGTRYGSDGMVETERLQVQARVWEPEAEALFDEVGLKPGFSCIDLGCGAMGVLGPLARRVAPGGRVVGIDTDERLLVAASEYVKANGLSGVELIEGDAFATGLPKASFDVVHARYVIARSATGTT